VTYLPRVVAVQWQAKKNVALIFCAMVRKGDMQRLLRENEGVLAALVDGYG
jgi:hypothetical protein